MTNEVIEGGQSFAEQCVVIKWLEEAGVDFFDISGGTYESPAWRGNIMTELAERPSQKQRGRYVLTSSLIPPGTWLFVHCADDLFTAISSSGRRR